MGCVPLLRLLAGVCFCPEEFVQEAINRRHPSHLFEGMSASMRLAIDSNSNSRLRMRQILERRASFFKKWIERAKQLDPAECELHEAMPAHRAVLEGKRALLFGEMLSEYRYRGAAVAKDLAEGFQLVGTVGDCSVFPFAVQPASFEVEDLSTHGPAANASIFCATGPSQDTWVDSELWRKTCEEVEQGWLSPISQDEAIAQGGLQSFNLLRLLRSGALTTTANLKSMMQSQSCARSQRMGRTQLQL